MELYLELEKCPKCNDRGEVSWQIIRADGTTETDGTYCDCPAGKALYNEHTQLPLDDKPDGPESGDIYP